ncbi:MAG: hypothetical protein N4A41_11895 [Crocinitomicaceae bacterium]|jgi:hypothetical protein|nr:hypothetical protein [Crocinitomicaceae bacterium]
MRIVQNFVLALIIFSSCYSLGQTTSGPNNAGSFTNDASVGTLTFSNPTNGLLSDDSYASVLAITLGPTNSQYLKATNFGFSIPADATIKGVTAQIEKSQLSLTALLGIQSVVDNAVRLVKSGVATGNNKAAAGNWAYTDATTTYGSSSDLWGLTLTPSDVNNSNFGVAISSTMTGIFAIVNVLPVAYVDQVTMSVTYEVPLPVGLTTFTATSDGRQVTVKWQTATEINNDFFETQYSVDGSNWAPINETKGVGYSTDIVDYQFVDPDHNRGYYRLKQVDFDGKFKLYDPVYVDFEVKSIDDMIVSWNSNNKQMLIYSESKIKSLYLYAQDGSKVLVEINPIPDKYWLISFDPGIVLSQLYYLNVEDENGGTRIKKVYLSQ